MAKPKIERTTLYVAWSNNCQDRAGEKLYVGHAWMEGLPKLNRTLCGVEIQEIGERIIKSKQEIGCGRCRRSRFLK